LSTRPRLESLRLFLDRLAGEVDDVAVVVVYGSMARGDYDASSDWDVLLVVRSDAGLPILQRFLRFGALSSDGWVQVFPYTTGELETMFATFHLTVLDALEDGIPIYDDGTWAALRARFLHLRNTAVLTRLERPRGWKIVEQS
jgi:predicted nucleotidyltransferase